VVTQGLGRRRIRRGCRRIEEGNLLRGLVAQELADLGIVSGSIDATNVAALDRVAGDEAVEEERTYQLPGPDSPVQ